MRQFVDATSRVFGSSVNLSFSVSQRMTHEEEDRSSFSNSRLSEVEASTVNQSLQWFMRLSAIQASLGITLG